MDNTDRALDREVVLAKKRLVDGPNKTIFVSTAIEVDRVIGL